MSKSYVFIQHLLSKKEPKMLCAEFAKVEEARAFVQSLLDSSVDVSSVEMFEAIAHAKKVTNTVWN